MKPLADIVVVIPVGPNSSVAFIQDTVDSYHHYTKSSYKIIFADDSQQGTGKELKQIFPASDIITTTKAMGGWAGLYITLSLAFRHAVEQYTFKAVLKLDTDALIIGEAPERQAMDLFYHIRMQALQDNTRMIISERPGISIGQSNASSTAQAHGNFSEDRLPTRNLSGFIIRRNKMVTVQVKVCLAALTL